MSSARPVGTNRILLLSIRSKYAEAILRGHKTVELRRRRPKLRKGDRVLIYASGEIRALVGAFIAKNVIEAPPRKLWRTFGGAAAISHEAFNAYFTGRDTGVAISVASAWRAPEAVELEELRRVWPGFVPPQSYRYVEASSLRRLPGLWMRLDARQQNAETRH